MQRSIELLLLTFGLLLVLASEAEAQAPVTTYGVPTTSMNKSGILAGTNSFQLVLSAQPVGPGIPARNGCTIINNGGNVMFVSEGTTFSQATAAKIVPGQAYYCQIGSAVLQGAIYISGTKGDPFYASSY